MTDLQLPVTKLLISFLVASGLVATHQVKSQEINFATQIRPILNQHCIACHGADDSHREADLRLDNFKSATESAIVPGAPDESELIQRVSADDDRYVMPPAEHGKLSQHEIELLRRWIESGAVYSQHWSFVKPQPVTVPQTKFNHWVYNEIDHFIANKLEKTGLSPSVEADPYRLLRRVSLDLTGLPPSDEQIARMRAQPDLKTYEQLVDELLASPAYGEHWTAMWLDLARYADTIGYTEDHSRTIWPWRDWVIHAFNENVPFDQFTIEQLAGDLLPNASESQVLATAFHRNTLSNSEGGTIDEEFRVIAVKDRINTSVNVWMGLTMRCAECHTHKYDPISIQEYYQFYDYFNHTADSDRADEEPRMDFLTPDQQTAIAQLDSELKELTKKWSETRPAWFSISPETVQASEGLDSVVNDDQSVSLLGKTPANSDVSISFRLPSGTYHGLQLEVMPEPKTGNRVGLSDHGNFILSQFNATLSKLESEGTPQPIEFSDAAADFSQADFDVKQAIRAEIDETGWAVYGSPEGFSANRVALFTFKQPLVVETSSNLDVSLLFRSKSQPKHIISRFRVGIVEVEQPAEQFRQGQLDPIKSELLKLRRQLEEASVPVKVPIMKELNDADRRTTRLMTRGSYLSPGESLVASVPNAFHQFPADAPANRLGVAKWLVDSENPLTARVTVNRFWARLFGRGIVETEEDFGVQGSMPTHPQLLDWLANDFQQNGWNVKQLLKQLVMSSTYRQANQATAEQIERDPLNLFYSRGPRVRLTAEVLRDQALMVSGLLSDKMYGPPVFPPSPIKRIRNSFAGDFIWSTSMGEDRYRRAIYTFLKRSQPHPLFDTFDMAARQVCSFRRHNTNTPLQSFMTLNDEAFVECAQHLARKMRAHSNDLNEQLRWGLETALRQPADAQQVAVLARLVQNTSNEYAQDLASAKQIAGLHNAADENSHSTAQVVELANLTVAANIILNLDAILTK